MSYRHLLFSLSLLSSTVMAGQHIVIAQDCLFAKLNHGYHKLASANQMSIASTDDAGIEQLALAKTGSSCGGFRDVTEDWLNANPKQAMAFLQAHAQPHSLLATKAEDYKIRYKNEVEKLLSQVNPSNMWDNLTSLSSYRDRYANSDTGVKAAAWLKTTVEAYAKANGRNDVHAYYVDTGSYKQPSLVVKIGDSNEPGVVVGAHMDTVSGEYSVKPGADDDGSGTVTVLEATRTLLSSGLQFKKPLYIIWYAAEEEGLVGSDYVVKDFQNKNIPVRAVIHFDLTGYAHKNDPTMWLIQDNVDKRLTKYLGELITTYVKKPIATTACGYACSDHATWTYYGYAASIPAEAAFENTNPNIHSSRDTMDKLSLEHMTDYTKLAVAFAVELAEPNV